MSAPNKAAHTPWTVYHDGMNVCDASGHIVSTDVEGRTEDEARANACLIAAAPQLLEAVKAQHEAIDYLFALLITKTKPGEKPFYPSESGQPWEAIQMGKRAIEAAKPPKEPW